MPDVRTYRAATMREALDQVRAGLGRDAVILATREVPVRRLLPWGPRREVEITAGVGIATKPITSERTRPHASVATKTSVTVPRLSEQERRAAEIVKELRQRTPDELSIVSQPYADRANIASPDLQLSQRLDVIERLLEDLRRRQPSAESLPPDLLALNERLLSADVAERHARALVERLWDETHDAPGLEESTLQQSLVKLVQSELTCCGPIAVERGERKVVALVGPTGVGKTTTLAKLAANFRIRERLKIALVTVDTYRIAAVEQLRTYAEIIDLPMHVVTTPEEMRDTIASLHAVDLVLIDTAGRSPRDERQIAELRTMLAAASPDETHLVLSLAAGEPLLARTAARFQKVNPTAVIATKLDEVAGAGTLIGLCRDVRLPISYLTTGQDVPDDIEPALADQIARSIVRGTRNAEGGTSHV